jgi:hypothetical protein
MPVQQQAVLDELLAGENKKTLLGSCRWEGGQVEASATLWLLRIWQFLDIWRKIRCKLAKMCRCFHFKTFFVFLSTSRLSSKSAIS